MKLRMYLFFIYQTFRNVQIIYWIIYLILILLNVYSHPVAWGRGKFTHGEKEKGVEREEGGGVMLEIFTKILEFWNSDFRFGFLVENSMKKIPDMHTFEELWKSKIYRVFQNLCEKFT